LGTITHDYATQGHKPARGEKMKKYLIPFSLIFGEGDGGVGEGSEGGESAPQMEGAEEDLNASFKELVNGKYKDVYQKETQRIIDKRFKATKNLEKQIADSQPIIDTLMQRYGIQDNDMVKLSAALDDDNNMWAEAADEAGMTIDQYKSFKKLERENQRFAKERENQERERKIQEAYQNVLRQADEVKKKFPSFNLEMENQNPEFVSMVSKGIPVEHAYKMIHMDEIIGEAMKSTAVASEKRVVDNIRANGQRPVENAASRQSAFTAKTDVSKLTKEQRREAAQRAARGEMITFSS